MADSTADLKDVVSCKIFKKKYKELFYLKVLLSINLFSVAVCPHKEWLSNGIWDDRAQQMSI